jgi:hypothetical protein
MILQWSPKTGQWQQIPGISKFSGHMITVYRLPAVIFDTIIPAG